MEPNLGEAATSGADTARRRGLSKGSESRKEAWDFLLYMENTEVNPTGVGFFQGGSYTQQRCRLEEEAKGLHSEASVNRSNSQIRKSPLACPASICWLGINCHWQNEVGVRGPESSISNPGLKVPGPQVQSSLSSSSSSSSYSSSSFFFFFLRFYFFI